MAVDMAYFRICAKSLKYKPPLADSVTYKFFSAYITDIYRVHSRFEPQTPQQLSLLSRSQLHDSSQTDG